MRGQLRQLFAARAAVSAAGRGFTLGGATGSPSYSPISAINKMAFSNEALSATAATLSGRWHGGALSSSTKGYYCGGQPIYPQVTNEIDGLLYSTETAVNPAAGTFQSGFTWAGVSSTANGYLLGGYYSAITYAIQKFVFATEAAMTQIAATLSLARYCGDSGAQSATKGYALAGYSTAPTGKIDGLLFSTEAAVSVAATLSTVRNYCPAVQTTAKAYVMGHVATPYNNVEGFTFATETTFAVTATLTAGRQNGAGVESSARGYVIGGSAAAVATATTEAIDFATEANIQIAATLGTATQLAGGVSTAT